MLVVGAEVDDQNDLSHMATNGIRGAVRMIRSDVGVSGVFVIAVEDREEHLFEIFKLGVLT